MTKVSALIAGVVGAATLLPLLPLRHWWIRIFDFPRVQIAGLAAVGAIPVVFSRSRRGRPEAATLAVLGGCLAYQLARTLPYTPLWVKQVQDARAPDEGRRVTLLLSNVLMTNRNAAALVELVRREQPDILLAVEADTRWSEQLRTLRAEMPHTVACPLGNTYGMVLLSRLELIGPQVRTLVQDDVPSIHTQVRLRSGEVIDLRCVHPRPPVPTETDRSAPRDAELLLVGDEVKDSPLPRIVAGDLNDVAWSRTTKLFQKVSGLLDPRVGRGFYNTFHAQHPLLRFSLDHLFHSHEFRVRELRVLPDIGSDHFPLLVSLSYEPDAAAEQPEPQPQVADREEKHEAVREARESTD